jgi:hypothetical protein
VANVELLCNPHTPLLLKHKLLSIKLSFVSSCISSGQAAGDI